MTEEVEAMLESSGISDFDQEVATSMVGLKLGQVFKDTKPAVRGARHSGKLPGWGKIFEICTSDDSMLGKVADDEYHHVRLIRITKDTDFGDRETVNAILDCIRKCPGWSVHGSLPCTFWSQWQRMNHNKKPPTEEEKEPHVNMLRNFIEVADAALAAGGTSPSNGHDIVQVGLGRR